MHDAAHVWRGRRDDVLLSELERRRNSPPNESLGGSQRFTTVDECSPSPGWPGISQRAPGPCPKLARRRSVRRVMVLPRGRLVLPALLCIVSVRPLAAQNCAVVTSRTSLAALAGRRIDSVKIVTAAPEAFPGPLRVIDALHVRTRDRTVRRLLLFRPGEAVDSLAVVETLRRLREGRLFTDVSLAATDCGPDAATTITVFTRDVWTTRPRITIRATGANSIGFEERNFLGTGRAVSISLARDQGRLASVASLSDPDFLGRDVNANLRYAEYADGHAVRTLFQTRERSAYDRWRNSLFVSTSRHAADLDTAEYSLSRDVVTGLLGARVYYDRHKTVYALAGGEFENTLLHVNSASQLLGPEDVERRFRSVDIGLGLRTAHFAVTDWLVPHKTIVDIPLGFEGEAVLGIGREVTTGLSMSHLDLWTGRMWLARRTTLFVTDVWAYGYYSDGGIESGSYRGQFAVYQAARGGQWLARISGERLLSPDPDVRALATVDPLIRFISPNTRLAESALLATVERSWHVWSPIRSFTVDGALFTTVSRREGNLTREVGDETTVYAAVIGAGVRLVPTTSGVGPGRVDIIYPLVRSPTLSRKIFLSLSVSPWLGADRHRDSFRDR